MRIISKFKDYYDIGASMGVDKAQVFVRKNKVFTVSQLPEEIKSKLCTKRSNKYKSPEWLKTWRITPSVYAKMLLVVVAGKAYTCIKMYADNTAIYCYSVDDIKNALKHYKAEDLITSVKSYVFWNSNPYSSMVKTINTEHSVTVDMHIALDSPVFVVENKGTKWDCETRTYFEEEVLEVNPILKDLEFYRVLDPYTAYQEINMFKFGVMPDNRDVPQTISDVCMRDSKGFDNMSFKKRKKHKK